MDLLPRNKKTAGWQNWDKNRGDGSRPSLLDQAAAISASETAAAATEAAEKAAADQTAEYQAAAEQGATKARADEEQAAATQAALKAKADEDQAAAERAAMKAREDEQNAVNERAWRKDEAAKKAAERAAKLKAEVDAAAERRTAALTAAETEAKEARIKNEKEEEEKLRAAKLEEAKAKERQRLKALKKQMKAEAAEAAAKTSAAEQAAIVPAEPHTPEYAHASPSSLVPAIVPASPAGEPEAALAEPPSSDSLGSTPTQRRASREEKNKTEVATAKGPPTEPPGDVTAAAEPSCAAHSGNDNASAVEALHQKNLADLHAGAVAAGPMIHLENIAEACEVFSDAENTSGSDSDTTIGFGK